MSLYTKYQKEPSFKFLKKLNKQLISRFVELKTDFQRNPPPNTEIRKHFLLWKGKYDQLVHTIYSEFLPVEQKGIDFKQFVIEVTENFGNDQDFIEILKNLNSSIESIKDFIRENLLKDPTIYEAYPPPQSA